MCEHATVLLVHTSTRAYWMGVTEERWLDDQEQQAWHGLMAMQEGLGEFIERQLRSRCGLSNADFQVLAHLSEAFEGRLRSFQLTRLLHWRRVAFLNTWAGCQPVAWCCASGASTTGGGSRRDHFARHRADRSRGTAASGRHRQPVWAFRYRCCRDDRRPGNSASTSVFSGG